MFNKKDPNLFLHPFRGCNLSYFPSMKSIVTPHFPQIVFEQNEKFLFNPILKKRFKNRPEERVRLRWVEYLLQQTDWLKTRIGFETPVKLRQEKNTLRADLVLFSKTMEAEILIECKAPSILLNENVAAQAARYNVEVNAPFLCLTNGISDFWFKKTETGIESVKSPLNEIKKAADIDRSFRWWADRGFISNPDSNPVNQRIVQILNYFWSDHVDWDTRYLDFRESPLSFGLNHYYRVPSIDQEQKLAISFLGKPGMDPVMSVVLNRMGKNEGLLVINLKKLSSREADSGLFIAAGDETRFDAHKKLPIFTERFNAAIIDNLPVFLMRFFD